MNKLVFRYPTEEEEEKLPYEKRYCLIVKVGDTEYILEEDIYFTHAGSIYHIYYDCNADAGWESTTLCKSDEPGKTDRDLVDSFIEGSKYTIEGDDLKDLVSYIVDNSVTLEKAMSDYDEEDEDEDDDF